MADHLKRCVPLAVIFATFAIPFVALGQEKSPIGTSTIAHAVPVPSTWFGTLKDRAGRPQADYRVLIEEILPDGTVKCRIEIVNISRSGTPRDPCKTANLSATGVLTYTTVAGRTGNLTYEIVRDRHKMLKGSVTAPGGSAPLTAELYLEDKK